MPVTVISPLLSQEETKLLFYISAAGKHDNQRNVTKHTGSPEYQWLYGTEGEGKLILEDKEYIISKNMGFLVYPNISHEYFPVIEPWETRWFTFEGCGVPMLLDTLGLDKCATFHISDMPLLEKLFNDIYTAIQSNEIIRGFECSACLYNFFMHFDRFADISSTEKSHPGSRQLKPVILYIEQNYQSNITLDEMASIANMSLSHFCRLFKKTFNMRPFEYISRFRVGKAKEIIVESKNLPLRDIASMVGFKEAGYFSRIFKEYEGITPNEFKKLHFI